MNTFPRTLNPKWLIFSPIFAAITFGALLRFVINPSPIPEAVVSTPSSDSQHAIEEDTGITAKSLPPASPLTATTIVQGPLHSHFQSLADQFDQAAQPSDLSLVRQPIRQPQPFSSGRTDPFAPITQPMLKPANSLQRRALPGASLPAASQSPASVPVTALPASVPIAAGSPLPSLPAIPVVSLPPQSFTAPNPAIPDRTTSASVPLQQPQPTFNSAPRNPVEVIELSGVVQVGDRVGIITRESTTASSRHAFAGDYLLGGQVLVKAIDLSQQEPLVIFEYQGREYQRVVGSGNPFRAS